MPLLIRQIPWCELTAYEAAGWELWPPPELRRENCLTERDNPLVALRLPRQLSHQDLMRISAAPLEGLAAVQVEEGKA